MLKLDIEKLRDRKNLLGFSGGVDSSALFFLLLELGIDFDLALVNYHTRVESNLEEEYARELGKRYGKEVFIKSAQKIEKNFEHRARQIRYAFFDEIMSKYQYENLILAHQLNDRLEWFFMQLLRGGSLSSMLGFGYLETRWIQEYPYQVVRPLWEVSRKEIVQFLEDRKIKFFYDQSNGEEKNFRNHIRQQYANSFLQENPKGILKSFEHLRKEYHRLYPYLEIRNLANVYVIAKSEDAQVMLHSVDKILKILGYVMSEKGRNEALRCHFSLVLAGKYVIDSNPRYIFITYQKKGTIPRDFKDFARRNAIPPKVRLAFYEALQNKVLKLEQLNFN